MGITVSPLPVTDFEVEVTPRLIEDYRVHGFTSIDRITTDEELEWIREVYDELFTQRRSGMEGGFYDLARPYDSDGDDLLPQAMLPERVVPELLKTTFLRNARRIAAALLDREPAALEVWGHMISKPPYIGKETPWHQDEAYWEPHQHYHAVGVWMPLDDCDETNGCMTFVPGTQHTDVLEHRHVTGDPKVHGLEFAVHPDVSAAVAVPLAAGGATFHHPRTYHYTGPNQSERRRRAYASEFQTTPQRSDEVAHRPWVYEGWT